VVIGRQKIEKKGTGEEIENGMKEQKKKDNQKKGRGASKKRERKSQLAEKLE